LVVAVAFFLITTSGSAQAQLSQTEIARLDSVVRAAVEEHQVVGLQVAVGIGDEVAWSSGYGMADLEHESPVTSETRFRTASISKWMTATAAMRLVEQGHLDLDAPVQQYCSAYPEKRWTVTTRNLLMHRAGVRHYWGANREPRNTPEERAHLRELSDQERLWMSVRYTGVIRPLDRFKNDTLLFEPGTQYRYTSFGYRLVGCVLQGAGGAMYAELMDDLVFDPAGMTHTINDDAFAIIPGRARGYTRGDGGDLRRSRFRDVSENLPAGGHLSTATDLVSFALAYNAGRLVTPESIERMTAPPPGVDAGSNYYGFGVGVSTAEQLGGRRILQHSGGQNGTRTLLALVPDAGVAVATMTNYEPFGGQQGQLIRAVLGIVLANR
jgi:CubicO group peptidase (beta-lactamase class C family)